MTLEVTQHHTADEAEAENTHGSSRRTVLRTAGVGGAVVAVGVVAAACGSSSNNSASSDNQPAAGGGSSAAASSAAASSGSGGSGGTLLVQTSDVPVDGGTVVTQPAAGTYKAFTAVCTHAGCTVGTVSDNKIMCPCHGSVYSAMDGSVLAGPAPAPLAAKQISVSGGQIFLKS